MLLLVLFVPACAAPFVSPSSPASLGNTPTETVRLTGPIPTQTPTSTPNPTETQTSVPITSTAIPTQTLVPTLVPVTPGKSEVTYSNQPELQGYLCVPEGVAPLPAVIYHHGGKEGAIGGAPEEACAELAQAGFVGFAPIRRSEESMDGNLQVVLVAAEYVRNLPYVDTDRMAILGFSRGGLLTFLAAADRPNDYKAIVIMAAAVGVVNKFQNRIDKIAAPVLLLISENDVAQADHLKVMMELEEVLLAANKETTLIVYPPFGNDGHRMFFEIGSYWQDVELFLTDNLK